jgi:hypothetical protein
VFFVSSEWWALQLPLIPFGVSFEATFKNQRDQRCVCKKLNLKTKLKVELRINTLAPVLGSDVFEVAAGAVESVEVVVSLALEAPVVETWRNQTSIKYSKKKLPTL